MDFEELAKQGLSPAEINQLPLPNQITYWKYRLPIMKASRDPNVLAQLQGVEAELKRLSDLNFNQFIESQQNLPHYSGKSRGRKRPWLGSGAPWEGMAEMIQRAQGVKTE